MVYYICISWEIVTILLKGAYSMKSPYSTYHGRKSWLRRILIAIVVLLVIALAAAIVGLFVLPNYVEYTPDGPRLVLPFFGSPPTEQSPSPTPGVTDDPAVIIDLPDPTPEPTPVPTPIPEMLPRRDAPLGLVSYEFPRLLDGAAKESLAANRGAIFDVTEADLQDPGIRDAILDLPYAVAMTPLDGSDETLTTLAGLGFDEILLTGVTEADAAKPREVLAGLGYLGRLSVVAEKSPFQDDTALGRAMAEHFDRVYVPGGNWGGLNLYKYLKDNGFAGTTADIVTTVGKPLSANYSWAILP